MNCTELYQNGFSHGHGSVLRKKLSDILKVPCFMLNYVLDVLNCSFEEGLCNGWENVAEPYDQMNWTVNRGRTPTMLTGPIFDHTVATKRKYRSQALTAHLAQ